MLAIEVTLILSGLAGFSSEYVPVFLQEIMYIKPRFLRGVIKILSSKNCPPGLYRSKAVREWCMILSKKHLKLIEKRSKNVCAD